MARESMSPTARSTNAARWSARARRQGLWFDCSTLKEPYRLEGKKVMGFELAEQLGWEVPDAIFYPTGGGTGLIGMWKAFDELEAVGLIGPKRPRMYRGPGRGLRADRPRVRGGRGVRRAVGGCGDGRDRHPRAQGGRRFPDPARGARQRRRGARGERGRRSCRRSRMSRATTASCSVPKAARCWRRGGWRWSAGWSARTSACCCSIAPTATNIRCRIGRADLMLAEASADRDASLEAQKRVNPGNRSCRGSMFLCPKDPKHSL